MLLEENLVEVEKIEMYGVLCISEEFPEGVMCSVQEDEQDAIPATKKQCKKFIKQRKDVYPNTVYKIFKMKFKEKK